MIDSTSLAWQNLIIGCVKKAKISLFWRRRRVKKERKKERSLTKSKQKLRRRNGGKKLKDRFNGCLFFIKSVPAQINAIVITMVCWC